jgi:hypothetical protein
MILCKQTIFSYKICRQNTKFLKGVLKALRATQLKSSSLAEGQPEKKPLVEGNLASQLT